MESKEQKPKAPDMREIMADYDKAIKFFHETPAEVWEMLGPKNAMELFQDITSKISGYRQILKDNNINIGEIQTIDDFNTLPIIDKYNYVQKYGFNEVNYTQAGKDLYCFLLSSGTIDEPTMWPRNYQYEQTILPMVCDNYFRLYWELDKKSTLIINAIALGPWNAGFTMHHALRPLTQKYNLTLSTNGADLESIIFTIKKLSQYYDQTAIFSYTTFHRTILERLEQDNVDIKKLNLKLFTGGEGCTVEWVEYINKMISGDPHNLTAIIDGYGTSEGSLLGMGSALTTLIRQLASKNKKLCQDLFGRTDSIPNLFQYAPASFYIEEINGEVIFTSKSTAPLVRYNLHDRGGIIKFREMEKILSDHGYDYKKLIKSKGLPENIIWQQPFVYCFGRRDDTVIIAGANVFPEQIAPALFNEKIKDIHSFKLVTEHDKKQRQIFYVLLELKRRISYNAKTIEKMKKKYHNIILKQLKDISIDYAAAYKDDPVYGDPKIEIFEFGTGPFSDDANRTKPRLVIKK